MRLRAKYVRLRTSSTRDVSARWKAQYCRNGEWDVTAFGDSKVVYDKLIALGKEPSREAVAEIIGNKSWSFLSCNGCSEYHATLVEIGEYEEKSYCETCLSEALDILKETSHG